MRIAPTHVAALAGAGLALMIPSQALAKSNTKVTADYNGVNTWAGEVKSSKKSCRGGRLVTLYRKDPGAPVVIGTDETSVPSGWKFGIWAIPGGPTPGDYYAHVAKKGKCDADKSKTVTIEARRAKATKTKVEISTYSFNPPGMGGQFQIEVKSEEKVCKKKRKVTLFRDDAGGPTKIGAEKTISGEGTYVAIIEDSDDATSDPYYATVKKEDGCAADRSKDYFIAS